MGETRYDMGERHGAALAELAQLGLDMARDLQARALAAQDDAAARDLALAFHAVARTVRQTLALEAKLDAHHRVVGREVAAEAERARTARVNSRKHELRMAVSSAIWAEAEAADRDSEELMDDLEDVLNQAAAAPSFLEDPIEPYIARIRASLGLPPADDADEDDTDEDDEQHPSSPSGGGGGEADGGGSHPQPLRLEPPPAYRDSA